MQEDSFVERGYISITGLIMLKTKTVYCSTCRKCEAMQLFTFSTKREAAFTSLGFSNGKVETCHRKFPARKEIVAAAVHGINVSSQINSSQQPNM